MPRSIRTGGAILLFGFSLHQCFVAEMTAETPFCKYQIATSFNRLNVIRCRVPIAFAGDCWGWGSNLAKSPKNVLALQSLIRQGVSLS